MKRKVPQMKSDREVEAFIEQDLSDLDFSQFKPHRFEFENKDARVNMRIPKRQLDAVKAEAKRRGIPYQRLMRELLQTGLERLKST
jgi:predicted DNA binding CopG/RHH family protein